MLAFNTNRARINKLTSANFLGVLDAVDALQRLEQDRLLDTVGPAGVFLDLAKA